MSFEKQFKELSRFVYYTDSKHDNYDSRIKKGEVIELEEVDLEHKILKTEDNTVNGIQAMAVAPVKDGKVDTSEVVIAYAGTNPTDKLDIKTDIQTVILGLRR